MALHVVILAGGRGERFWPLSRRERPKQMLALLGSESLLMATLRRVMTRVPADRLWLAAASDHEGLLRQLDLPAGLSVLWETAGRNTAPALGAAALCAARAGAQALLVVPSDHWIPDAREFWRAVEIAEPLVQAEAERIVTFGIRASHPETGYGYVERGAAIAGREGAYDVTRFHEKPDRATAERYLASGRFYWNSGIFVVHATGILRLLREHVPALGAPLDRLERDLESGAPEPFRTYFESAPSISIDHAVAERARRVAVVEATFEWSDLGSWPSWGEHQPADALGNQVQGACVSVESGNNLVYSESGGLVGLVGVHDLVVVRLNDATLVCSRDRAQDIRKLVEQGRTDEILAKFF